MKSKIVIILSSLIILMMCASVVSAAVENSGNDVITELNNDKKLIDTKIDENIDEIAKYQNNKANAKCYHLSECYFYEI